MHVGKLYYRFIVFFITLLFALSATATYAMDLTSAQADIEASDALPIIDDFNEGIPAGFASFADAWDGSGSTTTLSIGSSAMELPIAPVIANNNVVTITYDIALSGGWDDGPGYGGVSRDFSEGQDWTGYNGFSLWFYGSGSESELNIELKGAGDGPGASNRYVYAFNDTIVGWRYLNIPWRSFVPRTDFNPGPSPEDALSLAQMWGYSLLLTPGSGTIYLDHVALTKYTTVHNFEEGVPSGFVPFADAWDGSGSSTMLALGVSAADLPLSPTISGNTVLSVTYDIALSGGWDDGPGYGGVTYDFSDVQDWSGNDNFAFWFKGSNTGNDLNVELKSAGDGPGSSNRYIYTFSDDATEWQLFNIPFASFTPRTDFNPGPSPDAPIDLSAMWGYSILLAPGSGQMHLDQVMLSGQPVTELTVAFADDDYRIDEGEAGEVTVNLNMTAATTVTVAYASSDGTATAGSDYTAVTGTVIFAPGTTSQSFTVETTADEEEEANETIFLTLSDPAGAILGSHSAATLHITDDDRQPEGPSDIDGPVVGNVQIIDNFEDGALPNLTDIDGLGIGFITWSDGSAISITTTEIISSSTNPAPLPNGQPRTNMVLQMDSEIDGWGGFTHAFTNRAASAWISQDWRSYEGFSFWLHGNDSNVDLFVDIIENRNPGSSSDDAERWSYGFKDDFDGWKRFSIPFSEFQRKEIGNGAPNDGLSLNEMHGWAFGSLASNGPQTHYLDNVGLVIRTTVIDDFEQDGLPTGTDANGLGVGFVTWNDPDSSISITATTILSGSDGLSSPPGIALPNTVLHLNSEVTSWGGFTHAFTNDAIDTWVSQDWSSYEGIRFWLYGNNSNVDLFVDIIENRNPSSTTDDAERWSYGFKDDFIGWRQLTLPFSEFQRKEIGNGAPNDEFPRREIYGWAFGSLATNGPQSYYLDMVTIYGNSESAQPLEVQLSLPTYEVTEGASVELVATLSMSHTEAVTVDYATVSGSATADRDYVSANGTLTFDPGMTEQRFSVEVLEDIKHENDELILIQLSNPTNVELGGRDDARITIKDNDAADANLLDDFGMAPYLFEAGSDVRLSTAEITSNSVMALPEQGAYEDVLAVEYGTGRAMDATNFGRTFAQSQDWGNQAGFSFWFHGENSGSTINIEIQDNRQPDPGPSGWMLAWSEEFNEAAGTAPNAAIWKPEIGDGSANGIPGWGNGEFEYYTNSTENAATDGDGNLVITAKEVAEDSSLACYYGPCRYTSARLITNDRVEFAYGRVEARLKVPFGQGIWPAFWMLGTNLDEVNWPNSGEIDIMENIGREPSTVHGTIHGPGYSGGSGVGGGYDLSAGNLSDEFHVFAIEWEPGQIRWFIDETNYYTATTSTIPDGTEWVFDHPFFIIMNVAVGGNWPGSPDDSTTFPQSMHIDYVRVYQGGDTAERYTASFDDNSEGWQKVSLPFSAFTRSASQPDSAPDDGLDLSEIWGYSFELPAGNSGTVHFDQVRLADESDLTPTGLDEADEPERPSVGMQTYLPIVGQ